MRAATTLLPRGFFMNRVVRLGLVALVLSLPFAPLLAEEEYAAEIAFAERVGRMIFEKDRAAWVATDVLLAATTEEEKRGIQGWVTVETESGWLVSFLAGSAEEPCSPFKVVIGDFEPMLLKLETCEALDERSAAMFRARQTAIANLGERCPTNYNTIVLPADVADEEGWLVYLLSASSEPDKIVAGGHVRFLMSPDGGTVTKRTPLSNTCLTLERMGEDVDPVAQVVTHVISDTPIETHVFLNLSEELALYVITDVGMWSVDDGKLRWILSGQEWEDYKAKALALHEEENKKRDAPKPAPSETPDDPSTS